MGRMAAATGVMKKPAAGAKKSGGLWYFPLPAAYFLEREVAGSGFKSHKKRAF